MHQRVIPSTRSIPARSQRTSTRQNAHSTKKKERGLCAPVVMVTFPRQTISPSPTTSTMLLLLLLLLAACCVSCYYYYGEVLLLLFFLF